MSSALRAKMLKELTGKHALNSTQIGKFFDKGEVRIEKKHWEKTYFNALIVAKKKEDKVPSIEEALMPDTMWRAFMNHILSEAPFRKGGVGGSGILVRYHTSQRVRTPTSLMIPLSRGKNKKGDPYTGNVDNVVKKDLKGATQRFWHSTAFKTELSSSFKVSQTQQEYEHGATGEADFLEQGGTSTRAPGAQGTIGDATIIKIIADSMKSEFNTSNWYSLFFQVVHAKWSDMFGYDSELTQADGPDAVKGEVIIKAAVVPMDSSYNPGGIDVMLRKEFKDFLTKPEVFRREAKRLVKGMNAKKADALFSDSPPPSKRMEDAAIKLAAAGILDKLSDKIVRKEKKVGRPKGRKKRGNPTTAKQKGGRTNTNIDRKAGVRKRGRPSKASQALGGNPLALKEIINAQLPKELLKQMGSPALNNRTGRFRQSAQVTNVMMGPRGGVHLEYSYMKNPYATFEPGGRQGSTARDPRRLIGATVREIAQEIMGKRFVKVRSV